VSLGFGYLLDANARLMLFVVSFVAAWIHLFSVGYMREDEARGRFFGGLSIFMFSILGIVVADNLLMTFIFWELVGFSSYMLIAHYFDKDFAAAASKKAFITNRVGDLGFILGIAMCLSLYGTLDFAALKDHAAAAKTIPVAVGALLMCGFLGKSAQFPLHVWLTDAMAGPTPVSALIHAATMVAAGVYFMARVSFLLAPEVLQFIAISGARHGRARRPLRPRADGHQEVPRLFDPRAPRHHGLRPRPRPPGARAPAHGHARVLQGHAVPRRRLGHPRLSPRAGHARDGRPPEEDAAHRRGLHRRHALELRRALPRRLVFQGRHHRGGLPRRPPRDLRVPVLAALATCLYSGRMIRLVFLGEANSEEAAHAHESPWTMTLPLVVLGLVYSVAGGFLASTLLPAGSLQPVKGALDAINKAGFHLTAPSTIVGLLSLVLGFLGALKFYGSVRGADALQVVSPRAYHLLEHRWMDGLYRWYVDAVQRRVAEFIAFLDLLLINGVAVRWLGGGVPAVLGYLTGRSFHRGQARAYALWIVLGSLFLAWCLIAR
jgi:NADH-quinone oxidoreductase subunit L